MFSRLFIASALTIIFTSPLQAADDISKRPWSKIVEQAKQEGQVVWYNWFMQPRFRQLVSSFEQQYGIKVTIPDGTDDGNKSKFLAERERPEGDIDVMSIGGDNLAKFDIGTYFAGPLDFLPQFANLRTQIDGGDSKGYAVAYWGNQTGLAYDPTQIEEKDLPQTFEELTLWIKSNPQSFAFNDSRGGGAGSAFVQAVVRNNVTSADLAASNYAAAWDWFKSNSNDYGFTASNADSLTRLNGGEFKIVAAWEDHLAGLQQKGEIDKRMKFYIPKFGMLGGGNVVGVPANAKHKAAALVFIDWLTSAGTQEMLSKEMGSAPVNSLAKSAGGSIPIEQRAFSTERLGAEQSVQIKAQFIEKVVLSQ